ncbi:hypothetical protein [Risungbinella massiliensis]|uniref:hypothetical protein n=1 Tax=Risungbinella massiliensis TaxID=1329796 RepID=UPI0005CC31D9|nr:hypothetical protein [Risungbinella massiliensis]
MGSVLLTPPEEAESKEFANITAGKEVISLTQVDYSNHRYIFQRRTGETEQLIVLREDGSTPSFEEIQPVVDLVLQFERLQERYRELFLHPFGDYISFRELSEILTQIEIYFAEYSDVFPRTAFQKVAEMTVTLLQNFDLIAKTMQQLELSLEMEVLSEMRVTQIQRELALVLETYQHQVMITLQNIGSCQQLEQYLQRHIAIWQVKWRRLQNRFKAILEEFQHDIEEHQKWLGELDVDLYLPDEEKEKAYEILGNQKLLLKEA